MRRLCLLALVLFCSSCIVEAPGGDGEQPQKAANTQPATIKNGAVLGGKIQLLGARFQPAEAIPGQPVRVTLYFRALDTVDEDYSIFVHVEDADGKAQRANFDHPPMGGRHPTSQWKKGETVPDQFELLVPQGLTLRAINLFVGLWQPKTGARVPVSNADQVRTDGQNRVLLAQLPVAQM